MLSDEEKISLNRMKLFARSSDLSVVTAKDMNIVVTLVEKQSKEIEELKKPKYVFNCKTNEITKLTNDFVSKDKIKAKIDYIKNRYNIEEDYVQYKTVVIMLQSLLEKE